jgi:CHAT domain-containing protein
VLGQTRGGYVNSLNNLAAVYQDMGDYPKAEQLYRQALVIENEHYSHGPGYATILNNLAALYQDMGDFARAEPLYRRALALRKEMLGEKDSDYAISLSCLAYLFHEMGDYLKAEPLYRRALDIRKEALGQSHPDYAVSLHNLARLYDHTSAYAKAEPLYRQALAITRDSLSLTSRVQAERQQLAMTRKLRYQLDNYLCCICEAQKAGQATAEAPVAALYQYVLFWKGAVFASQRRRRLARSHPELADLFSQLQDTSRQLATLALAVPVSSQRQAWHEKIADLTETRERLEADLSRRCADFSQNQQMAQLTIADLQRILPANAVLLDLLEYWHQIPDAKQKGKLIGKQHVAAFVLRPKGPPVLVDLGTTDTLTATLDDWRKSIAGKGDGHGRGDPAAELRRRLWQPLEKAIGDARLILVSPDGVLGKFPFAALPGSKADSYLIEERQVAMVAVPQLLPELLCPPAAAVHGGANDKAAESVRLLLVGDADFGAAPAQPSTELASRSAARGLRHGAVGSFSREAIQASRGEVLAVRDSFEQRYRGGKARLLRGQQATEAAFRQQAPRCHYLHLATHGFFAPPELKSALGPAKLKQDNEADRPESDPLGREGISGFHPGLLSGLALAGANRVPQPGEDDGILTALEVAELDLRKVDLAVLSACETGLGETAGGEGLLGLQRAFQVSGARTVVATLWKVDDEWTRKLMERFYENLWQKKMTKLQALREAQRWVMREGPRRGIDFLDDKPLRVAPPFYWAAFVLSGDWR